MELTINDLIQFHKDLEAIVEQRIKDEQKRVIEDRYESVETKDLYTALASAQGEFKTINYNRRNQYYMSDYADLDALVIAVRESLAKYKLSFLHQIRINNDGMTILHTRVTHATGQWIESRTRIITEKSDYHSYGSSLSFMKRTSLESLLGITSANNPEDDDAEYAQQEVRAEKSHAVKLNTKYDPKEEPSETITKEQLEELNYELSEYPDIAKQIMDGLRLQSLADMPKSKYMRSVSRIREIKDLRNNPKR